MTESSSAAPRPLPSLASRWDQWTTSMVVCVAAADGGTPSPADLSTAEKAVRDHLEAVDRACSRFREDSELVRLNEQAGRGSSPSDGEAVVVPVSALLASHLQAALDAALHTDGSVDPTVGAALVACGYDLARGRHGFPAATVTEPVGPATAGPPAQPAAGSPALTRRRRASWRDVVLEPSSSGWTVRVPVGVQLDLGATAKAKAADDAADLARAATGVPVLVALGGDVAVRGTPTGHVWPLAVAEVPGEPAGTVTVGDGGVATSTVLMRRWSQGGVARHHLLDPLTGQPVVGRLRSATVAAGSCLAANAASTAVLVRPVGAVAWLQEAGLAARLVDRDGHVERVGGWPADAGSPEVAA